MKKPYQRTLFPLQHQFVIGNVKGQPYIASLFVGFTAPFMNLPTMMWRSVIKPPITGLTFIIQFFFMAIIAGLMGRAHGFLIDMPEVIVTVTDGSEEKKS